MHPGSVTCSIRALLWTALAAAAFAAVPARASVVLLDEHWSAEIMHHDVAVTEIDTEQTGDPTQAVAGYFSALLENATGAPSVRFRGAAGLRPADLPPEDTEGRLWYRTDNWNGTWTMEVWLYIRAAGRPIRFLEGELDGGGEDGRLIADDQWHQARGRLWKGPEWELAADQEYPLACFVWLRPTEGWDIAHRTYVDRIEAVIVDGPRKGEVAPRPSRRVRPRPGAQLSAPGLVLWEGEDAVEQSFPTGSAYLPGTADEQRLISNGAWLSYPAVAGARAAWEVDVPEPGSYALWARGFWYQGGFRWRIDDGEWRVSGPDRTIAAAVNYQDIDADTWGIPAVTVGWTPLGRVDLSAGEHVLQVECMEDALGFAFDCWVLASAAFEPPAQAAGTSAQEAAQRKEADE